MSENRHGAHNKPTISFRASTYEREQIFQRIRLSGMTKQDYIIRSCIYGRVCVVGHPKTFYMIRKELKEMYSILKDINQEFKENETKLTEEGLVAMEESYKAFLEGIIVMLEGAKYLWEDVEDEKNDRKNEKDDTA